MISNLKYLMEKKKRKKEKRRKSILRWIRLKLLLLCCFFASLDVRDTYYSILIDGGFGKLFCFKFRKRPFEFQCLPRGFRDAHRAFIKVLKPVLSFLLDEGHTVIMYFDDSLIQGDNLTFVLRLLIV